MPKSLFKKFKNLKVSHHDAKATNEIIAFLRDNGFVYQRARCTYLTGTNNYKSGYIHIVQQESSGKTIAFEIDYFEKRRAIERLIACDADYKILFMKNGNSNIFISENEIEVIPLRVKTDEDIFNDNKEKLEIIEEKRLSGTTSIKGDSEKQLYDKAHDHLINNFINHNEQIGTLKGLHVVMKRKHPVLYEGIKQSSINYILKKVHDEWRGVIFYKKKLDYASELKEMKNKKKKAV